MQAGYVYILHGVGTSYIKIGKTTNFERRMGELATGVPFALRILSIELVYDMDSAERALKARYQAFRTRGEWFELSLEALAYWPAPTPEVRALQPLMVRQEKAVRSLSERILDKLETHDMLTTRTLCRMTHSSSTEVHKTLCELMDAGKLQWMKSGRRTHYLRVVPSPIQEESLYGRA